MYGYKQIRMVLISDLRALVQRDERVIITGHYHMYGWQPVVYSIAQLMGYCYSNAALGRISPMCTGVFPAMPGIYHYNMHP